VLKRVVGVGIDVGADRLHIVGLEAGGALALSEVADPSDLSGLGTLFRSLPKCSVAIDGPPSSSAAPFAKDPTVSNKFRNARGCEVMLGREFGIWVSFATGPEPLTGWMRVAAEVHSLAQSAGHHALETYPHAVYRLLLGSQSGLPVGKGPTGGTRSEAEMGPASTKWGSRPPKKTTAAGIIVRVEALRARGLTEPTLPLWSHDGLDAAAAAVVALDHHHGTARRAYCREDDSSIWLPAQGAIEVETIN
jgi:Protein of unknown function (DUF429)